MAAPRQMTAQTLNALKGWPQMHAVDFHTEYSDDITDRVPAGACVHLGDDGKYVLGVGNLAVMPMFMFNASDDPDVVNDGGDPATEKGVWVGISPTGQAMSLVAVGAYELVSTAYTGDDADFPPNTPLTSPLTGDDAGRLVPGTMHTNMIVGLVSRGVTDNGYGTPAVAFWPCPVFPG